MAGRKVKCAITGETGTSDTFYRGPDKRYYKSEELYNEIKQKRELHRRLVGEILMMLGYEDGMVAPPVVNKKLKELSFYGDDIILETLHDCFQKIEFALRTRDFANEYNKISYVMAIVKNNINDVYLKHQREQKQQARAQAAASNEIHFEDIELAAGQKTDNRHTDISRWVGGDV